MAKLPFINHYPYTNFEQLNLDRLFETVASYDERIKAIDADNKELNDRLDADEVVIESNVQRITSLENMSTSLEGRMSTAESNISALTTRVTNDEGVISSQGSRITALESQTSDLDDDLTDVKADVAALRDDMDTAQSDISSLGNRIQGAINDITGLDSRVTDLEGHTVVANPGGTGAQLNTLAVDGVTYTVPSGGSGGGSSVTPNPTGTPSADLTALDIDGIIYGIPAVTQDTLDEIEDIKEYIDDINIKLNDLYFGGEYSEYGSIDPSVSGITSEDVISDRSIILTNAGSKDDVYLISVCYEFNTRAMGSKQRDLGIYLKDDDASTATTNVYLTKEKFVVWGSEKFQITQAADMGMTTLIKVPVGETRRVSLAHRVQVDGSTQYNYTFGYRVTSARVSKA